MIHLVRQESRRKTNLELKKKGPLSFSLSWAKKKKETEFTEFGSSEWRGLNRMSTVDGCKERYCRFQEQGEAVRK